MKIKLHYILSSDVKGIYVVDTEYDQIEVTNVIHIVKEAKRKFRLPGKHFTALTSGGKVFHVSKVKTQWKVEELRFPDEQRKD